MVYPKDRNIHRPPHTSLPNTYYFISARTYYSLPFLREEEAKRILKDSIDKAVEKFNLEMISWVILNNHYHWLFKAPENNRLKPASLEGEGNTLKRVNLGESSENDKLQFVTPGSNRNDKIYLVKPFKIGIVVGYVHGRSSSLINKFRRDEDKKYLYDLTPQEFRILQSQFAKKWGPKYEQLERQRVKEFERLIDEQDSEGLMKFVRKLSKIWYQYTDHIIKDKKDFYRHINYIYQNPVKHGYVEDILDYKFSSIHEAIKRRGENFVLECFEKYPIVDFESSFADW